MSFSPRNYKINRKNSNYLKHNASVILQQPEQQFENSDNPKNYYTKFILFKLSINKEFFNYVHQIHKYLIKNSEKFKYIASHINCQQQKINDQIRLKVDIEKGNSQFSFKQNQIINENIYKRLISFGIPTIINFIEHITRGILELEKFGLWHLDLHIRNTILVNETFKIIDFEYAIKIKQIEDQYWIMKSTKKILTMFINDPSSLKYSINNAKINKLVNELNKNQGITQKVNRILLRMQQQSKKHHRRTFKECLTKIVEILRSYNKFEYKQKLKIYTIVQKFNENLQLFLDNIKSQVEKSKISQISEISQKQLQENGQLQTSLIKKVQSQAKSSSVYQSSVKTLCQVQVKSRQSQILSIQLPSLKQSSILLSLQSNQNSHFSNSSISIQRTR